MAKGADKVCTSTPPRLGPPTNDSARLPFRIAVPSKYRSRGTSDTNSAPYDTINSTLSVPTRNATTKKSLSPKQALDNAQKAVAHDVAQLRKKP